MVRKARLLRLQGSVHQGLGQRDSRLAISKLDRDQSLRGTIEGGTGDQRSLRTNGRKPRRIWVGLFEAR